ncbi:hypothetical protein [Biformimicrobium ophioploci]|uniref:Sulfotransferase family protein n=1 Tax=Biformimicrobium ophioploci TaxID=3036711 RepID=A0ABQ6LXP7_9GAMM|nr:hypothetical protein [Microbulbifer sp. NKW57]GMG86850.1 hypothetical protein MNKW57_11710 [Microbulbifer sp. NKW57]
MKVILHAGIHKTGTSAIQKALGRSSRWLNLFGYTYPVFSDSKNPRIYNHSRCFLTLFKSNPALVPNNLIRGFDGESAANRLRALFEQQLREYARKASTLVMSGEALCILSTEELRALRAWFVEELGATSFEVIYFAREHEAYIASAIQQSVKGGGSLEERTAVTTGFAEHLYKKSLAAGLSVFDRDEIRILSFHDACAYPDGLVKYFIKTVLTGLYWWPFKDVRANESVCLEALEIISAINETYPRIVEGRSSPDRKMGDVKALFEVTGTPLACDFSQKSRQAFAVDAAWLESEFGVRLPEKNTVPIKRGAWSLPTIEQVGSLIEQLPPHLQSVSLKFFRDTLISRFRDDEARRIAIERLLQMHVAVPA